MPCTDSSSRITIRLDPKERFVSFEFGKITCGKEIAARTGYSRYLRGQSLQKILAISFQNILRKLNPRSEEKQFVLYCEWEAVRCAIAQYLGVSDEDIDHDRCRIASIKHTPKGTEIVEVILPPKDMPAILPCGHKGRD
jgi:hypothetical protein